MKCGALILRHCFPWRCRQGLGDSLGQEDVLSNAAAALFSLELTLISLLLACSSPRCPTDPLPQPVMTPGAGSEKGISSLLSGNDRLGDIRMLCIQADLSGEPEDSHTLICVLLCQQRPCSLSPKAVEVVELAPGSETASS